MRVYVASSWRNARQPRTVQTLREAGHVVYDFREPEDGVLGFQWADIDPHWQSWTPLGFREALHHPIAVDGFSRDMAALEWADACVLLLPCGRSSHLEAGWAKGHGKPVVAILSDGEPELMYSMFDHICFTAGEATRWLQAAES